MLKILKILLRNYLHNVHSKFLTYFACTRGDKSGFFSKKDGLRSIDDTEF